MSTISFRTDPETDRALADLTADGRSQSSAIRDALLTVQRQRAAERLRAETEAIAGDPEDLAEIRAIQSELESLRAW